MRYGLYIHIPFCLQKCHYCDFPSAAGREALRFRYVAALKREMAKRREILRARDVVDTVYFGGGTPTILEDHLLLETLDFARHHFPFAKHAEITVEANPGTVDRDKLAALRKGGFNRISIGVQSFQDDLLKEIGRIHTAAEAEAAVNDAVRVGFSNISVDLMYGLPKQSVADLAFSVEKAVSLNIQHISVYGLKVEEGTVFAERQGKGALPLPDDGAEDEMYEYVMQALPQHGYARYEISNFAANGFISRHNVKYWRNEPYIGIGAAAHACYHHERFANIAGIEEYIEGVESGKETAYTTEKLMKKALMEEFCFLGLRMAEGISVEEFARKFHCNIFAVYGNIINRLCGQQVMKSDGKRIYLTEMGMKYGNQIFSEFLLP